MPRRIAVAPRVVRHQLQSVVHCCEKHFVHRQQIAHAFTLKHPPLGDKPCRLRTFPTLPSAHAAAKVCNLKMKSKHPPTLEDDFSDIVAKARRGLGLSTAPLPSQEQDIRKLASELDLRPAALLTSASRSWHPAPVPPIRGLHRFSTRFGNMAVNSYLVVDPSTNEAAAFDTGADCSGMLAAGANIRQVFLTHIHGDHIADLDQLMKKSGATAFVSAREPLPAASPFPDGAEFSIGSLRVRTLRTSGHAAGGTTFVLTGLEHPLAFTGDALFAGSMGGAPNAWPEALDGLRNRILALPPETILCPGHGPLTTVAEERLHNPFA
jgi:glyoxylase-like metal-dependent hydrolase (beta-lactamase superfamily II)